MSVPLPIATPISATLSAGASLIPSPTIITGRASSAFIISSTWLDLPSGNTSDIIFLIPAFAPISLATSLLSPERRYVSIPISCNLPTVNALSGLISSCIVSYSLTVSPLGIPLVIVPVLSNTTLLVLPIISIIAADLKRILDFAALPLPTIIATGVASPRAQGQLTTSTDTPCIIAVTISAPSINHIINVIRAIIITAGTK